jgi:hypothetical protein
MELTSVSAGCPAFFSCLFLYHFITSGITTAVT